MYSNALFRHKNENDKKVHREMKMLRWLQTPVICEVVGLRLDVDQTVYTHHWAEL